MMNNKKIKSFALFLMLLLAASVAVFQTVTAEDFSDSVRGYIYVDGVIQQPNELTMSLDGEERNADELYTDGYYIINFGTGNITDAEFIVSISEGSWLADQNEWKTDHISGVTIYYINLSIDTSEDPIEPPEPNSAPNTPSNPSPADNANNRGINVDLSWTGGDSDSEDTVTYDIYFGTNNPPTNVESDYTTTSYDPGQLNYDTTYYWQIISEDNNGATTDGPLWIFSTESDDSGDNDDDNGNTGGNSNTGTGGGGGSLPPLTNQAPVADAGDSYVDFIDAGVTFDGSDSTDSDGDIVGYRWDFDNDGNWDTEWLTEPTIKYTYSNEFDGKVKLEVKDDDDATDTDTAAVNIMAGNNPPTKPTIIGASSGDKDVTYDFSAVSTDPDDDNIKYVFYWNDKTNSESEYLANGTQTTKNHSWNSAGKYTISVNAYDGNTWSGNSTHTLYIDAIDVSSGDVNGYIIDEDGDDSYESFYDEDSDTKTSTGKENSDYLLNTDDDENFEYKYNTTTGDLTEYKDEDKKEGKQENNDSNNTLIYLGAIVFVVILLILFYLVSKKKKQ